MNLKQYMATHEGEYLLAETTRTVTVTELDGTLCNLEVEPYLLGEDPTGRRRIQLYGANPQVHIVTYIEQVSTRSAELPRTR